MTASSVISRSDDFCCKRGHSAILPSLQNLLLPCSCHDLRGDALDLLRELVRLIDDRFGSRAADVAQASDGRQGSSRPPCIGSALSPQRPTSTRGRQRQGKSRLARHTRSCGGSRRADGGGRLRDELIDGRPGDEAPASDYDAGELVGPKELVDSVSGNATEELAGFLDGEEGGF